MTGLSLEKGWWRVVSDRTFDWTASDVLKSRIGRLDLPDEGLGYDRFGLESSSARLSLDLYHWLYVRYFRTQSFGIEHLPQRGPYILAPNHTGPFPLEALMIMVDVLLHGSPPRLVRPLVNRSLSALPYVNIVLSRTGCVWASRSNMDGLLNSGQPIMLFPEGPRALAKRLARRHRTMSFNPAVVELAIKHQVPIVPVGVVGLSNARGLLPYEGPDVPQPASVDDEILRLGLSNIVPVPTRVRIQYGAPFLFHDDSSVQDHTPTLVRSMTDRLQSEVQRLIDDLLAQD